MFSFVTDTATICIFDPSAIMHRKDDDDDWWTDPDEELEEVRAGNAMFVGLGEDGKYSVRVADVIDGVAAFVRTPSGRLYIGAGEEVSAGGFEPNGFRGGRFFNVSSACCVVRVGRGDGPYELLLSYEACQQVLRNEVHGPLRLQ